jgi:membrane fusion protein, macrolide-specific efflux system
MKRKTKWIVIGAAAFVVIGLVLGLWFGVWHKTTKTSAAAQATVTVSKGNIANSLVVYGSVVAKQDYTFTFSGDKIKSVLVSAGVRVAKGQTLVELDTTQQELALLQAQRSLAEARATGAPADVREKELALAIAEENLDNATLKAPFAGVVTKITQSTTSSGNWSLALIDTSELYIDASVDQLDAPDVAVGQSATATIEALPDKTWSVEIVDVGGTAQTSGNSTVVVVTAKLPEADSSILVGYTAEMEITTASASNVLLVPISCLRETPRGWAVTKMVNGTGTAQEVTVGITSDDYAEIQSGLQEGDQVLVLTATATSSSTTQSSQRSDTGSFTIQAAPGAMMGGFGGPGI